MIILGTTEVLILLIGIVVALALLPEFIKGVK